MTKLLGRLSHSNVGESFNAFRGRSQPAVLTTGAAATFITPAEKARRLLLFFQQRRKILWSCLRKSLPVIPFFSHSRLHPASSSSSPFLFPHFCPHQGNIARWGPGTLLISKGSYRNYDCIQTCPYQLNQSYESRSTSDTKRWWDFSISNLKQLQ